MDEYQISARLQELHAKYKYPLELWLDKYGSGHKLYQYFVNMKKALEGTIAIRNEKILNDLQGYLKKFFPDEKFFQPIINLDSDDDDTNNDANNNTDNGMSSQETFELPSPPRPAAVKVPPHHNRDPENSIATYKTKRLMLKPAAAYAKPSENDRPRATITVPYKQRNNQASGSGAQKKEYKPAAVKQIFNVPNFDPKEDAIKLAGIKEKIYAKNYLKVDDTSEANDLNPNDEQESASQDTSMITDDPVDVPNENDSPSEPSSSAGIPVVMAKRGRGRPRLAATILEEKAKKRRARHAESDEEKSAKLARFLSKPHNLRSSPQVFYAEPDEDDFQPDDKDEEELEQVPITKSSGTRRAPANRKASVKIKLGGKKQPTNRKGGARKK